MDKKDFFKTDTGKFYGEVAHKATVEREETTNEKSARAGKALRQIGDDLNFSTEHAKYMGSAAVHIYASEVLGQGFFISQVSTLDECPEPLASTAMSDLQKEAMKFYGRTPGKKRSGF